MFKFLTRFFNSLFNNKSDNGKRKKKNIEENDRIEKNDRSKGSNRKAPSNGNETTKKEVDGEEDSKSSPEQRQKEDEPTKEALIEKESSKKDLHEIAFLKWAKHVLSYEGGLSKDDNDYAYYAIKGTKYEYHTNMGIVWSTFERLAVKVGLAHKSHDTDELYDIFIHMDKDDVFMFLKHFWSKAGGDRVIYPSLSAFLAEEFWGGGYGALMTYQRWLNNLGYNLKVDGIFGKKSCLALNDVFTNKLHDINFSIEELRVRSYKMKNPKFFDKNINFDMLILWINQTKVTTPEQRVFLIMNREKIQRYINIITRNPKQKYYEGGWDNRMENFFKIFAI